MKTIRAFMLAGIALLPLTAMAALPVNYGYVVDSENNIVKNSYGECWHTGYWTPEMAVAECDAVSAKVEATPPPTVSAMPAPPPPPPPAPAQEKMPPLRINLSEAAHFDFDESLLRPGDEAMLDDMVRKLDGATYESIQVTGHADRLGSGEYNMELSLRRANEVKRYLVSKGIPAARINAQGRGEMQPLTASSECNGMNRDATINCLQIDRRTEVAVVGSKGRAAGQK